MSECYFSLTKEEPEVDTDRTGLETQPGWKTVLETVICLILTSN